MDISPLLPILEDHIQVLLRKYDVMYLPAEAVCLPLDIIPYLTAY